LKDIWTRLIAVAIISAAAVVVPAVSFYLTKRKERAADWQKYKFEQYRDLLASLSGIVGTDSTPEGNRHFAEARNTLHLLASQRVLAALHDFQDEIRISNPHRSDESHDALLSRLVWEIREDLGMRQTGDVRDFKAQLWCSGTQKQNRLE
jgi:hypothetical protein